MPNVSPARQARGSRKRPSNNVSDNEEADSTAAVAGGCKAKASAKRQRVEGGKTGGGNGGEEEDKGRVDGDLAEGLVCTICASVLFQSVSVWPCLHTFCGSCLSRWMTQKKTCPQCRGKLEKKRVAMNPFVTRLVDELLQNHPHLDTRTVEDKKQQTEANRFLPSAGHVVQIYSSDSDSSSLGSLDDDVASGAWGLVELSDDDEDEIDVTTHEADTTYVPESDGDEPDDASALSPSGDSHDDDSDAGEQSTQTGVGDTSADVSSSMLQASGQSSMDEDDDDDAVPAGQRQRSSANSARRQRHRVSSRRAGSITSSSSDDSDSEWVPNARARPARRGGSGRRGRPRGRSAAGTARSARGSAS
jgi:hypothetical protein